MLLCDEWMNEKECKSNNLLAFQLLNMYKDENFSSIFPDNHLVDTHQKMLPTIDIYLHRILYYNTPYTEKWSQPNKGRLQDVSSHGHFLFYRCVRTVTHLLRTVTFYFTDVSEPSHILRTVTFYFTDVSEPSHISFARSLFILPMCQNRHTSSFCEDIARNYSTLTVV